MEFRRSRGRGGSGKRGGRGGRGGHDGHDGDSHGGEYRGRGGHPRGRSKRDHYRARGRGGLAADFSRRDQDEVDFGSDDHVTETFSRRKLESNWARYEASETQEVEEDTPIQRGADYSVLLQSAGDSFTQFRFADEKDWEMDSFVASQMSAFVDLPALAQLIQITTPVELPPQLSSKQEVSKISVSIPPPSAAAKGPRPAHTSTTTSRGVISPVFLKTTPPPEEDMEEDLDKLLSLQKPASTHRDLDLEKEKPSTGKACEEVKKNVPEVVREKDEMEEEVRDKHVTAASVKKKLTEEELEDWLDSMIS
uniref:Apoptosis, caspase activation inhibitor n=1 Tax=Neogobius melanostomus TaxID=47308 RepID=A0A8C6UIN7_9GOBI